jgi:hypothetical protein
MVQDIESNVITEISPVLYGGAEVLATGQENHVQNLIMYLKEKTINDFGLWSAPVVVQRNGPRDNPFNLIIIIVIINVGTEIDGGVVVHAF